mgnify:CR=1 FL=1
MAIEEVGIRLRSDGAVETANGINLAAAATGRLGQQAGTSAVPVAALARTSGQISQAMQQLPMQITDVVTSLASGMPVWMVAIQQGGQIRDSFGGIAPAFNAIRAAIPPMVAGIGGAAATLGVLTAAYQLGRNENDAYVRALLVTGNQAGVTAGSLAQLAAAQDAVNGTQREAAQVVVQLMTAGNVSRAQMALSLQAVIAMERELGIEAKTTVAELAKLGDDPLRAAVALHRQYGFLTLGVYEQIRALAEQGRTAEAAAVAQEAYATAGIERSKAMEEQLGLLERAWRGIKTGAGEAWDAMLGLGRQNTLQEELADIEQRLAQPVRRGGNPLQAEQRRDALRERRDAILEVLRLEQRSADQQAQNAADVRAKAEADEKAKREAEARARDAQRARERAAAEATARELFEVQSLQEARERELEEERETLRQAAEAAVEWDLWEADQIAANNEARLAAERAYWADVADIWETSFGGLVDNAVDEWGRFTRTGEFSLQRIVQAWATAQTQMQLGRFLNSLSGGFFNLFTGGGSADPNIGPPADLAGSFVGPPASAAGALGGGRTTPLGRGTVVFSPTIQIDSRTDRAEVLQLVQRSMQAAQAQLLESMERGEA